VDIVQAVGRAMRKPRGASPKTTGYIILPVFLSKADLKDPETAVEASAFAPVLQVLRALKAHDPYRATFFAQILFEQGKRPHKKGEGIDEILQVSIGKGLDLALAEQLQRAVKLRAVEVSADRFEFWYQLLQQFVQREGHAVIPIGHYENGEALGSWALQIRSHPERLSRERLARIDSLNFAWDLHSASFEKHLALLAQFVAREGHALVPTAHKEDGENLGWWVGNLRQNAIQIEPDQLAKLEDLGFIWNRNEFAYRRMLNLLRTFIEREGHSRVPKAHIEDGVRLGAWVNKLRSRRARQSLTRITELDQIGFSWIEPDDGFERGISLFGAYVASEGHARVPANLVVDGHKLGTWIGKIRRNRGRLAPDQIRRLEELGFIWDPIEETFERHYSLLQDFVAREGHAWVPQDHIENGARLGQWVSVVRNGRSRHSKVRMARFNSLGFVWDAREDSFESMFTLLKQFVAREGHARVPTTHVEDGQKLGVWAKVLRRRRAEISQVRRAQLEALGFTWNLIDDAFENNFSLLEQFVAREGHARVPQLHIEGGRKLGAWVANLRNRRGGLSRERITRLKNVGFVWKIKQSKPT
jgi:hypothetical protein